MVRITIDVPEDVRAAGASGRGSSEGDTSGDPIVSMRLPPELTAAIDAAARANWRTRSSEIRVRLVRSLEADGIAVTAAPANEG